MDHLDKYEHIVMFVVALNYIHYTNLIKCKG